MFDELILHGNKISRKSIKDDSRAVIPIRLPWYRNLPVCILQRLDLTINGRKYESKKDEVMIDINGTEVSIYNISHQPQYRKIIWCNLDTQDAVIHLDSPLESGDYTVTLDMCFELPYIVGITTRFDDETDQPNGLPQYVTYTKTMHYEKGDF